MHLCRTKLTTRCDDRLVVAKFCKSIIRDKVDEGSTLVSGGSGIESGVVCVLCRPVIDAKRIHRPRYRDTVCASVGRVVWAQATANHV